MEMEKLVSLCKRRGFLFQSSEIYGGLNGFWDYGPLGVELKRNIKEAWWRDMVTGHDDLATPAGAPEAYEMTGLDCTIIMHPQVWKVSGHYDLFCDWMVDCRESKKRYRFDQMQGRWLNFEHFKSIETPSHDQARVVNRILPFVANPNPDADPKSRPWRFFIAAEADDSAVALVATVERACKLFDVRSKNADELFNWESTSVLRLSKADDLSLVIAPEATAPGTLTDPREFNLMFPTSVGALAGEEGRAYLRPETAQGIFVNFKNVLDSTRVKVPFGIAQIGKSFRNEITPRNFTFRSREFEQMEIEFFCHPSQSQQWYRYWRDRRFRWYTEMGLGSERLQLREHHQDELSHYSVGTADIEYAFPFLPAGEFGELEGVAHRGDFDLRSHMEGKLVRQGDQLIVELEAEGKPRHRGSGKDLSYFDDITKQRFVPHVIEPSAGADRATLAFLCEAYCEDTAPDENGKPQSRVVLKLHPRIAPIKVAILPLVKKDGMPEVAQQIYRALKKRYNVFYDEKGAIGRRYRRQDEVGTPLCITVDGQTLTDQTVTFRDRDSLKQWRVKVEDCVAEVTKHLGL